MDGPRASPIDPEQLEELLARAYEQQQAGQEIDLAVLCGQLAPDRRQPMQRELQRLLRIEGELLGRIGSGPPAALVGSLAAGRGLDGFRIVRLVGSGGMGEVYAADQESLGRRVALKVLSGRGRMDPIARLRFQREAAVTAALEHPHIVPVYATGTVDGVDYLAMRFVEGQGLDRLVPLEPRRAAWLASQVAAALHAAHRVGVVHRDVKPANVLIEGDNALLVDFGLAGVDSAATLTRADAVAGTLPYMAPEQLAGGGHVLDPRVDVYGLGATLYEMLSGQPPFPAEPPAMALQQILRDEAPPLPRSVDRDLAVIVARALDKQPARRFPSAAAFAADLRRYLAGEDIESRPLGMAPRLWRSWRRHPVRWAAALLLAVAVTVILQLVAATHRDREARFGQEVAAFDRALRQMRFAAAAGSLRALRETHPDDARVARLRVRLDDQTVLVRGLLQLGVVPAARAARLAEELRPLLASPTVGADPLLHFALVVVARQAGAEDEARRHLGWLERHDALPVARLRLAAWLDGGIDRAAPDGVGDPRPEPRTAADALAAAVAAELRGVPPELVEADILKAEDLDPADLVARMRLAELRRQQGDVRGCYEILRGVGRVDSLWGRVPAALADVSAAMSARVGIDRSGYAAARQLSDVWIRRGLDHLEPAGREPAGTADDTLGLASLARWRLQLLEGNRKEFWADWSAAPLLEDQRGYWSIAFEAAFQEQRWAQCGDYIARAIEAEVDPRRRLPLRHLALRLRLNLLADEAVGIPVRSRGAFAERTEALLQEVWQLADEARALGERGVEAGTWLLAAGIGELRGNLRDAFLSAVRAGQAEFDAEGVVQVAWPLASMIAAGVLAGRGSEPLPRESERYLELVWTWVESALDVGVRSTPGWYYLHQSRFWLAFERNDGRAMWESAVALRPESVADDKQAALIRDFLATGLLPEAVLAPGSARHYERWRLRRLLAGIVAALRDDAARDPASLRRVAAHWLQVDWLPWLRDPQALAGLADEEVEAWRDLAAEVRAAAGG